MNDNEFWLNPFEQWMVKSNLADIKTSLDALEQRVATLKANGYPKIAQAVEAEFKRTVPNPYRIQKGKT